MNHKKELPWSLWVGVDYDSPRVPQYDGIMSPPPTKKKESHHSLRLQVPVLERVELSSFLGFGPGQLGHGQQRNPKPSIPNP